jgi:hypothetical protein
MFANSSAEFFNSLPLIEDVSSIDLKENLKIPKHLVNEHKLWPYICASRTHRHDGLTLGEDERVIMFSDKASGKIVVEYRKPVADEINHLFPVQFIYNTEQEKWLGVAYWDRRKEYGDSMFKMFRILEENPAFMREWAVSVSPALCLTLRFQGSISTDESLVETTDKSARVQMFRRESSIQPPLEGMSIETHWSWNENQPLVDFCLGCCGGCSHTCNGCR